MLTKFLEEVVIIVVGKQAEPIVPLLNSKKHENEFLIAKKMDMTINQIRNILYKLSEQGLVSSVRKKDKKKGWYTYFWKFEILKCLEFLKEMLLKKIEGINAQIRSRETKQFYVCERCHVEFNEETALLRDFTCNECGDVFTLKDNEKLIREFKRRLGRFNQELELIEEEIQKEKERLEKIKIKELKKIEKQKAKISKSKKKTKKKTIKKKPIKKKKPKTKSKRLSKKKPIKKKALKKQLSKKVKNKSSVKKIKKTSKKKR